MRARRPAQDARRTAGFTLVELMVGLTAGAILLSSVWILSSSSSQFFYRESRIATTQSALRLAAEQLHHDVARAGLLGHPNTANRFECGQAIASTPVQAVELQQGGDPAGTNFVRNDSMRLTGNYATNDRYTARGMTADLQTVRFDTDTEAFRRSFVTLDGETYVDSAFTAAFAPGRRVRLEVYTPIRRLFFRSIAAVNAGNLAGNYPTITLDQALPAGCINASHGNNTFIAPLVTFDYSVMDISNDGRFANLSRAGAADGAGATTALVRQEYDPVNDEMVEGSERSVLDYAVEFRITALDCGLGVGVACTVAQLGATEPGDVAQPQTIQGLRFHLSARTPEKDATLVHRQRTNLNTPLFTWNPDGLGTGAARVRTSVFDVALPNNFLSN